MAKYFLLPFPLASFGLGVWQLQRLEWKKGLISELEGRLSSEPVDLREIENLNSLQDKEYYRVKVAGYFDQDPKHQIFLKPRQLIVNQEAVLRGRTAQQSNLGVHVITPFCLDGSNLRILVNRGWLALKGRDNYKENSHIGLGNKDKPLELTGILRATDKRPRYGLANDETTNEWQFRDIEAMAKVLKTAPIYIDSYDTLTPGEGPIGGQTQLNVRNEHLNYAITWFSLGAFTMLLWYGKYGRRRPAFLKKFSDF